MRKHAIPRHFLVAAAYGLLALLMLTPASHARGAGAQASGPVSYADAVEKAAPAVVNVNASRVLQRQAAPFFDAPRPYRYQGAPRGRDSSRLHEDNQGSGVIVDARGYIVTNSHLVNGADRIEVVLHTGERLQAEIAGSDPDSDIAVLQVDLSERSVKLEPLPVITLGASS
ncbi:MAG: trypsin-like peptidase domain-containing protein, partial [Pseudomonadota bacterium]